MRALLLPVLLVASPLPAQDFACPGATSQAELNICANAAAEDADSELNRLWKRVKPQADARGDGQRLLDIQRLWLRYRDQTCQLETEQFTGGSIAPMIYSNCVAALTTARNERLRALLLD